VLCLLPPPRVFIFLYGCVQEAESKGTDTEGSRDDDPVDEEAARREEWQEALQQGLLAVHGLEFDKKWIRLLRVIKTQVHGSRFLSRRADGVFGCMVEGASLAAGVEDFAFGT